MAPFKHGELGAFKAIILQVCSAKLNQGYPSNIFNPSNISIFFESTNTVEPVFSGPPRGMAK